MTWGGMVYNWFTSDPVLQNKCQEKGGSRGSSSSSSSSSSSGSSSKGAAAAAGGGNKPVVINKETLFSGDTGTAATTKKGDPYEAHLDGNKIAIINSIFLPIFVSMTAFA